MDINQPFIKARQSGGNQPIYLNVNHIACAKQSEGNESGTDIVLSNGNTVKINTGFHDFPALIGFVEKK